MSKTIAVDFDGVIHGYSKGWHDGTIYDEPMPGAREALQRFMDAGYDIVVYSTRADEQMVNGVEQAGQYDGIVAYLKLHEIPHTRVHRGVGKPFCKLFIDDNALRFEGDWAKTFDEAMEILSRPGSGK